MIAQLDDVIRQLLINEIPIRNGEIDIAFDQPKREWSARLNRPTINIFLHDVRENTKLRNVQWEQQANNHRSISRQRTPLRIDLHYLITAWANEPEDEHRLLTATLMALFRQSTLPDELLPERLQDQPVPIPLKVAQYDEVHTPADLWSALDNELRPSLVCRITLALNPFEPIVAPVVRTRELRIGQSGRPWRERLTADMEPDLFWTIGGIINTQEPLDDIRLTLVERGLAVTIQPEGRFTIGNLETGTYTLEIAVGDQAPRQHPISVPSPDYEIDI